MPYDPTPAIWAIVIGRCRILGKNKLQKFVAEKLLEMRPHKLGYYVFVANMYADYGCWEKGFRLCMTIERSGYIMSEEVFNLVSMNSRRSSKQKIKVPIKYGDTICDLIKKKTGQTEEEIGVVNEVLMNSADDVNKDDVRAGDNGSCEELGK
ncbi:tetratricopeptide repeat (TPR)-like superfamily protein [Artemisia annua]|uniref:Tetratricopeptide repeat (TPR)-like superfamily protein n=1 Tax=Artemisia annua TaxID=35608 RepID=A0A2U1LI11_ARTAN|nr:tetratricopeptide repeat (TPR)-like superfamily protein [Artemisia annua]